MAKQKKTYILVSRPEFGCAQVHGCDTAMSAKRLAHSLRQSGVPVSDRVVVKRDLTNEEWDLLDTVADMAMEVAGRR